MPLQVEILAELTRLTLSGSLISASMVVSTIGEGASSFQADKVVHVGHSYGSIMTNLLLAKYPELSSAALLTGFLVNPKSILLKIQVADGAYALEADPVRWADRGSGYLAFGSTNAFQLVTLKKETLDLEILRY